MHTRLDGHEVHKVVPRNVLLASLDRLDEEHFVAEMVHDLEHPFFFEHPLDHIPAMMLVEAGRQMAIAISHRYLGVSKEILFATESFDIRFTAFAELQPAVTITAKMTDHEYRRGVLLRVRLDGAFSQAGIPLGTMGGTWVMLKPEIWRRYRRREQVPLPR